MKTKNIFKCIIAIGISELAGIVGAFFTTPAIPTWYVTLTHPAFWPPEWLFAPVWTTLYLLMGVAAYLVWRNGLERKDVRIALGIFLGQLFLNTLWSIVFFGLHNPVGAFVIIVILWLAIFVTIVQFRKIARQTFWLLLPYIAWVSFAIYLNLAIVLLN